MRLKYAADFQFIKNCPPPRAERRNFSAYRLVHDPIRDGDFLPIAKTNPARFPPGSDRHCFSFAISLFVTAAAIRRKFQYVVSTNPNVGKDVGTHIAEGEVSETDGLCTRPTESSGHVALFEAEDVQLSSKFSIKEALI